MINTSCKNCAKFKTNDCAGLQNFNLDACNNRLREQSTEIDVSGCC